MGKSTVAAALAVAAARRGLRVVVAEVGGRHDAARLLEGDGVLLLGNDEEEHPVRAGSVVARPAGTGVAHAFRGGDQGMSMLMFSDKDPNDMCLYPRSGKVLLRGLGITIKPEIVPWAD